VREAVGVVTTIEGSTAVLDHGSLVAGNPSLHHWLRELLRMSE
jgi:fructose-1,6-bisphosphatase/inositol monophosphatase family enzyme